MTYALPTESPATAIFVVNIANVDALVPLDKITSVSVDQVRPPELVRRTCPDTLPIIPSSVEYREIL